MKVHAYKVTARGDLSLDDVLTHISGLPLGERMRTVGDGSIRLEDAQKAGQTWSLDFGGIRQDGPGRAGPNDPIIDFDLAENEGFAEETAAIFNAASGFMALQFNYRGPRSTRIQGYLFRFARKIAGLTEDAPPDEDHGFTLSPVMKQGAIERLNHATLIKKIKISVYVPGAAHVADGAESLSGILSNPVVGTARDLYFEIGAGKKKGASLNINAVRDMVRDALGYGDDLKALEAVIKDDHDSPSEPIDLLEARLEKIVAVQRAGRRFGRPDRLAALNAALNEWSTSGQLA